MNEAATVAALALAVDAIAGDPRALWTRVPHPVVLAGRLVSALERRLAIWAREMYTGVYRPTWLTVETARGDIPALTFVVDPTHTQYAGDRPMGEMATIMAGACGENGRCRDYLAAMLDSLAEMGIDEPHFRDLLARVDRHAPDAVAQTSTGPSAS